MSRVRWLTWAFLGLVAAPSVARAAGIEVEPGELTKRADLVGREVIVDDRVQRFTRHQGGGIEAITLMRSPVLFRLPTRLGFTLTTGSSAARMQGILRRDGQQWVCDVSDVELFPKDIERLNRAVALLPAEDFTQLAAWARWAQRRGKDFKDKELQERGRRLEAEAIRIESEHPRGNGANHWLALARRAKDHAIPEPEPSAQAHRGFRARLAETQSVDGLQTLVNEVAGWFPEAAKGPVRVDDEQAAWDTPYSANAAAAYRSAPAAVRATFDRRLWADSYQRLLERRIEAEPSRSIALAEEAQAFLPERPEVADRFFELGLKTATQRLGSLRLSEIQALSKLYREKLRQPERGQALLRAWLDDKRKHHLSPTDAEGRLALAIQYEDLLHDQNAANDLILGAWKIDPQSEQVADAMRRRRFRKVGDEWIAPESSRTASNNSALAPLSAMSGQGQSLRGLTPKEVESRLGGKPTQVSISASQGQLIEQWIYNGAQTIQYVNFLRRPGEQVPTVVAYYSLRRTLTSPPPP